METLYGLLAKDMIEGVDWRTYENEKCHREFRRTKDPGTKYCNPRCREQVADANRGMNKTGKKTATKGKG